MQKISTVLYDHLIKPVLVSIAPVKQVSWGVAIGLFVGLTPTMGIQMYIVAAIWMFCRYVIRFHFNLPVGVALVWITNPVTVIPIYYLFLLTGSIVLQAEDILSFKHFEEEFTLIAEQEGAWNSIVEGTRFLLVDLGWPMLVGGLCYAVPFAIVGYFTTRFGLTRYRQYKAKQENISYEEWRSRYETAM